MNTDKFRWPAAVLGFQLLILGLGLAACTLTQPQSDTVRHFTLAEPTSVPAAAEGTRVQPVQISGHLRSRSMAVRVAENEVIYLDEVVWAEPLADGITKMLRNRLAPIASDALVSVQIERCELDRSAGNTVQLVASYSITPQDSNKLSETRGLFTAAPRTWDGKNFGALVGLLHEAVSELADRLVTQLPAKK